MLLWILIALLTGAAVMAVLLPLGRRPVQVEAGNAAGRVYLQQLEELELDRAQGRINDGEAQSSRAEIARRLMAVQREAGEALPPQTNILAARATALASVIGIPLLSLGLYLGLGAPALVGQPLAARLDGAATQDIETLVATVERHLETAPDDERGWDVIAPVYLRMGRAADAERAFSNAIRLGGTTAARQIGLGEAIVATQGGVVTAAARAAFEEASKADPAAPAPRFFLALAAEQDGKFDEAAKGWRALLAETPDGAPWRQALLDGLARVGAPAPSGPDAAQVAAAGEMAPADRTAMIEGMVEGLAERLKSNPEDVEGWLRLIRSYSVLGRPDQAIEASRAALQGVRDAGQRQRVEALVADLGLRGAGSP